MKDLEISAYIANLRKYNKGELIGEWVTFPIQKDELNAVYQRIGINEQYAETFVPDYDLDIKGMASELGEYPNYEALNYLAGRLQELEGKNGEKFAAILESGITLPEDGIEGLINLTYNLDRYDVIPYIENYADLGRYYVEEVDGYNLKAIGILADYIDYDRFGRDISINETGDFTDIGYIIDEEEPWNDYFDGTREDIPEEYLLIDSELPKLEAEPVLQAMEAAGYIFDRRESDSEHLRFYDTDTQNIIHMNSLNETRQWLEGVVFDDPIISNKVEGILYPERLQTSPRLQEKKTSIRQQLQQAQQKVKVQAPRQRKTEPERS